MTGPGASIVIVMLQVQHTDVGGTLHTTIRDVVKDKVLVSYLPHTGHEHTADEVAKELLAAAMQPALLKAVLQKMEVTIVPHDYLENAVRGL